MLTAVKTQAYVTDKSLVWERVRTRIADRSAPTCVLLRAKVPGGYLVSVCQHPWKALYFPCEAEWDVELEEAGAL